MTQMTCHPQRFLRIAITSLAISLLVPQAASAGGRGTGRPSDLSPVIHHLQSQLSALDERIAELERKVGKELAAADDKASTGATLKFPSHPTPAAAAAQATNKPGQ